MYPPLIKDVQPSFTPHGSITIYYEDNPAGSISDLTLWVKEYISSNHIGYISGKGENGIATFNISDIESYSFITNQNYKVQIAYRDADDNKNLSYSSAAFIKCVAESAKLGLETSVVESIGTYVRPANAAGLYSYWFELADPFGAVIDKTEEKIWSGEEKNNISTCTYLLTQNIEYKSNYSLTFHVINTEGLEQSITKTLTRLPETESLYNLSINATPNAQDGYMEIALSIKPKDKGTVNGQFVIERTDKEKKQYERLMVIQTGAAIDNYVFKDRTVEQGKEYYYSIRQFKGSAASFRVTTDLVFVDFEDMFLTDGERQLKIRFNPRVSSFKTTLQESKTDTIGGKYPIFYKNANLGYKEIPISGLISYQMDENGLFAGTSFNIPETRSTTPSTGATAQEDDISKERTFKLEVLDWLNNGKKKYFRSPQEGNYIVRLMNVSLSPDEHSQRKYHTFSCTAYEVAECNYENLKEMDILDWEDSNILWEKVTKSGAEQFGCAQRTRNIVWLSSKPGKGAYLAFQDEHLMGGTGPEYYNLSGIWSTPRDEEYPWGFVAYIEGVQSVFTYEYQSNAYDGTKDNFALIETIATWKSVTGATQTVSDYIYTLQVYNTGIVTIAYKNGLTDTIISDNNQVRTYLELSNVTSITASGDVQAVWLEKGETASE